MPESIKQRMMAQSEGRSAHELKLLLDAILVDLAAQRVAINALVTDMATRITNHNTLRTKLNADAGVTDVDYAAATAITAVATAALTTIA